MNGTPIGYRTPARVIHWIMALLVLAMIPAGLIMVQEGLNRSFQNTLFIFHKNMGVVLFFLILVRVVYRSLNPPPPLPDSVSGMQKIAADATHFLLYSLLLVVPLAGYIRVRAGGFPIESLDAMGIPPLIPRSEGAANLGKAIHYFAGLALAAVILLHIGAGLLHAVVLKDGVFSRIWPPFAPRNNGGSADRSSTRT